MSESLTSKNRSLQQRAMSYLSELQNTGTYDPCVLYGLVREMLDANWHLEPAHETKAQHPDEARLDLIETEYLHVIPFDMPTGQGDADVGWRVLQSHMGKPDGVEIACAYRDDIREAIDSAGRALKTETEPR